MHAGEAADPTAGPGESTVDRERSGHPSPHPRRRRGADVPARFAGTGVEDVQRAAAVSASQLYHYFADKAALVHAVVDHQADAVLDGQQPLLGHLDSFEALHAWRDLLIGAQRQRHCAGGCVIGSLASELADTDPPARERLAESFARWQAHIRDGLDAMRQRGELRPDADPDRLALAMLAAVQGGLLLDQTHRDTTPLQTADGLHARPHPHLRHRNAHQASLKRWSWSWSDLCRGRAWNGGRMTLLAIASG